MDLSQILHKLKTGKYKGADGVKADVKLVFQNCYASWKELDEDLCLAAKKLETHFDLHFAEMNNSNQYTRPLALTR
jgi:hypothetical protein